MPAGMWDDDDDMSSHPASRSPRCTDIPCCILFIATLVGMVLVNIRALAQGDLQRLTHGFDYEGNLCGATAGYEEKQYVYYCPRYDATVLDDPTIEWTSRPQPPPTQPSKVETAFPICVDICPADTSVQIKCTYARPVGPDGGETDVRVESKAIASYKTTPWMHRYCMPSSKILSKQIFAESSIGGSTMQALEDMGGLRSAASVFIIIFFLALVLAFVYLLLVKHLATCIIWVVLFGGLILLYAFGIYCFVAAGEADSLQWQGMSAPTSATEMGIAALVVAGISTLIILCRLKSISVAVGSVENSADCVSQMVSMLLVPLCECVAKIIIFLILVRGLLYLLSIGKVSGTAIDFGNVNVTDLSKHFEFSSDHVALMLFWVVASYWLLSFVGCLASYTLAYTTSEWYFSPVDGDGDRDPPHFAILKGCAQGLFYHTGTLAFAAFVTPPLAPFSSMLLLLDSMVSREERNSTNGCLCCCVNCAVNCFKKFVEYVNKLALIDTAVRHGGFCESCTHFFKVFLGEGPAFFNLMGATFLFSLGGILFIVGISAFVCHFTITSQDAFTDDTSAYYISNPYLVTTMAAVLAGLVGISCMAVLDFVSDAMLYCYALGSTMHRNHDRVCPELLQDHVENAKGGFYDDD